ncbi:hypothetical protein B566_EDAN000756 [Ephemera danica]|nr:hypothetical protein B566_EDAN000756 [Ephemera danica]
MEYATEVESRFSERAKQRQLNQNISRPEDSHFSRLDSSLKKNTAFVRKLKNFTANQEESLGRDMKTLNLSKYISEVAAAIVEAKLKMTDVPAAVKLCTMLHQTYAEFASHLIENWQKIMTIKKDDKLKNFFWFMCVSEHFYAAGLVSRKIRQLSEEYQVTIPRSSLLSPEKQKNVRQLFKDYCTSLCKHLVKEHKELQQFEYQSRKILQTRGELSSERKERMEALYASYKKLYESTQSFCDAIDEDMPELPNEEVMRSEELSLKVAGGLEADEGGHDSALWEDDETRDFYENLPDLKALLPPILYKDSAQPTIPQETDEALESKLDEEILEEMDDAKKEEDLKPPEVEEPEEAETTVTASNKIMMDAFLGHVMNCVSRDMIDNAASEFVISLNTKLNRKKLVKALFGVQRTRIDLLPFLARLVATLHPCMPDVATDLAHMLKQDFKYHVRKKDQINIESKIKVVRFIGEMVKFRMYSKVEALFCLKMLLHDFTHHHIEMVCNLLEACGRFLFCCPESHQRTKIYLEQMMRKKSVMALDSRYVTMIENAYYYVDPPEASPSQQKKERPPMHDYIRKLLYQDLCKPTTDRTLRQMRKLCWDDTDLLAYAVKCLTNVWNVRYLNIGCVASLLAGLVAYQMFFSLFLCSGGCGISSGGWCTGGHPTGHGDQPPQVQPAPRGHGQVPGGAVQLSHGGKQRHIQGCCLSLHVLYWQSCSL